MRALKMCRLCFKFVASCLLGNLGHNDYSFLCSGSDIGHILGTNSSLNCFDSFVTVESKWPIALRR